MTYTKTNTAYDEYGTAIEYTTTEHYSISDIVNSDKTPIPAAKELYDVKLKLAKEGLAKIEKEDHENYEKLKGLSDQQLMEAMFPTQVGEYERARSTWKENNKGWLQWVEIGGKIIAVGAIIAGSVLSGGTLAPILIGAGTAYLVADSGYQAISGETISGKRLTDGERIWAGVDAVLTAATGGFATYASVLAKTGKAASTTVQTVGKAVNYADDANDIAHTVTAMQDDPLGAALQFGIGRAIGHGATALGNKARARFGKGGSGADVDLPSSGKGVDLPAGNAGLKTHADTDVDPSTLGTGKKPKPEIQTPQHQEIPSPSKKPELDVMKTSKPEIDRASSPEITGPNKKPEIDTTKTAKPEIDNPSRPAVDKTNSELDTGKPVKPEVSQARPSEVVSPNSRPKEVDVTKKPDIEVTRPAEVNPTKVKPEMETKVKPDIDAAAASASAVPKVKAQEPDLPKAGQPEVTPDAGKKVQKPEEVDTEATKAGIGMSEDANYAQKTYGHSFSQEGQKIYSELAGEPIKTIDDLVDAIKSGKIDIKDLPVEYINRDGNTLILNTRTSQALTQSGIPRSDWHTIDRTGEKLHETLLDGQLQRNKLTSEGIKEVRPSNRKG